MNKRIKELVKFVLYEPHWSEEDIEKFAQLIVQECSRIAELKEQESPEYDKDTSVGWYIRQRFGVE